MQPCALGFTADECSMCEANFQTACLPPSYKIVQQRNHRESLQKKKTNNVDCWTVCGVCLLFENELIAGC